MTAKGEDWAEMAKLYQKLTVEVASRPITKMLELANARVPFAKATGIHDNGTGPGAVRSPIDIFSRYSLHRTAGELY